MIGKECYFKIIIDVTPLRSEKREFIGRVLDKYTTDNESYYIVERRDDMRNEIEHINCRFLKSVIR